MAFGKINKNKKMTQADLQGSEDNKKVDLPSKIIKEMDVELPEYTKADEESNLAKSVGIKRKKKKGKIIVILAVGVFVLLIGVTTFTNKSSNVVVQEEPEQVVEQVQEIIGDTDVSGLIQLKDRNKDRELIELHDDYIDLTILHPSDYLVKELTSEGVNVLNETIEKGTTRYSLQKSKLTGIVPIMEMQHKTYTPYTIRMQMGSIQNYLHEDEEFIKALSYMIEVEKEKQAKRKNKSKEKDKEDEFFYTPYIDEKIDYLNYCPVKVVEHIKEPEISEENEDSTINSDSNGTDTAKNTHSKHEEIDEKVKDNKNKKEEKETAKIDTNPVTTSKEKTVETNEDITADVTANKETLSEEVDLSEDIREIDLGDGNIIKYVIKNTPMPCESDEYLQSRLAFKMPLGYTVKQDNALMYKQEQAKLLEEEVQTAEDELSNEESNTEDTTATNATDELTSETEESSILSEDSLVEDEQAEQEEKVEVLDSKGNKVNGIDDKLLELFAEISETDKDVNTLDAEYDYATFKLSDRDVSVNSLLLDYHGTEIKYYEFKFMLGENEAYITVYGEIDMNINYILEDIRYLVDSIRFG